MTTALNLITGALQVISSVTPGEAVDGTESGYALGVLNMMMAAWSAESLMPPFRTLEQFTLTPGQTSYTIGTGANFNTVRPDYVTNAWRRDAANLDYPLEIISKDRYDAILMKNLSGLPFQLYYDTQYPNGIIYFYPTDIQSDTLFLESLKPLNQFSTLNATMILPGEYQEAIKYLLAKRLAPEYGFAITPDMKELMDSAEARIMRKNQKVQIAGFDAMLRRPMPFNIYTG